MLSEIKLIELCVDCLSLLEYKIGYFIYGSEINYYIDSITDKLCHIQGIKSLDNDLVLVIASYLDCKCGSYFMRTSWSIRKLLLKSFSDKFKDIKEAYETKRLMIEVRRQQISSYNYYYDKRRQDVNFCRGP